MIMKTIDKLTIEEQRGLAVSILREEFGYKWLYIAHIMDKPQTTVKRYYKKFQNIYAPLNKEVYNG